MRNDVLRLQKPVWQSSRDDGGMFEARLAVHEDPDGGPLPFLASVTGGFGGGVQARRASLEEARAYAEALFEHGVGIR